jgi:phage-related protein
MYNVYIDKRAKKIIDNLPDKTRSKARKYIHLFEQYGFSLGIKYLKKVDRRLWELRPADIRLFLFEVKPNHIIIHVMIKKSQKITLKTKTTITARMKEYL